MPKTKSIKLLNDFLRNTMSYITALKESHESEILTINGEATVVVQDAESYEKMAALADQARQDARLQKAMNYFREDGKGIKAADVFADLDTKYL